MNGFNKRLNKGSDLYKRTVSFLKENNISYFETGYENLNYCLSAKDNIIKNSDSSSIFVRYYPDILVVFTDISIFLEVKNSSGIEKDCYINYMKLASNFDLIIYIVNRYFKICRVKDIVFKPAVSYDKKSGLHIPITEGVWREPRNMNKDKYLKYLDAYSGRTSGCSFAFIDFDNSPFEEIEILKMMI